MDQRTRHARVQHNNRPRNPIKERPTRRDLLGHARGAVERVKEKLDIGTRKISRNPTRATTKQIIDKHTQQKHLHPHDLDTNTYGANPSDQDRSE